MAKKTEVINSIMVVKEDMEKVLQRVDEAWMSKKYFSLSYLSMELAIHEERLRMLESLLLLFKENKTKGDKKK